VVADLFPAAPLFVEATPGSMALQKGQNAPRGPCASIIAARMFLTGVELVADPQVGIIVRKEEAKLDEGAIPIARGSIIFSLGTLSGGAETILTFPVILTSGVLPGKAYEITLFARSATGRNSDTFHVTNPCAA